MEISSKLAGLAKRLPAATLGGEFEFLVRSIGEAKSKAEEDELVMRMTHITKRRIREGFSSKAQNPRALKDFLVYLMYIDMLGHDTSWACPSVIQLCGNKNLHVKKAAYLTASLLIDPKSELTILLTATIQADLKSDNFLTVCTALQAIPTIANAELVSVFLPEVIALVRHDKDQVKRKALLTMHCLLQVDPSASADAEHIFVEKLGYKEPSVMVSVLPGLYGLIQQNPEPYRGLVHYFTNILKQAAEGKLGRTWTVHRSPAPFLQIILLRLLALLGSGSESSSGDMQVIIIDVWRRAESLANQAGNAILFECMKTATTIVPSETLYSMTLDTAARFLSSTDNNLKCAGIETLSRLIEDGDAGKVQQHQLAIVDCLKSSDLTLKSRTLDLLFKMTGPNNIDIIFQEVLAYVVDNSVDSESRRSACIRLLQVAEKFSPSLNWFVDCITTLLKSAGSLAPSAAEDSLISVLRNGSEGQDPEGDIMLQHRTCNRYFSMLSDSKLPNSLVRVIAWTIGEFGLDSGLSFDSICTALSNILESYSKSADVQIVAIMSLEKLNARSGRDLPVEAKEILNSLRSSPHLEVQQTAVEAESLAREDQSLRKNAFNPSNGRESLAFLAKISNEAEASGSVPYISLEDRISMGMTRKPDSHLPIQIGGHLKFEAYTQDAPVETLYEQPAAVTNAAAAAAPVEDLLGGLDILGTEQSPQTSQPPPITVEEPRGLDSGPTLQLNRQGQRRWGPGAAPSPVSRLDDFHSSSTHPSPEAPRSTSRSYEPRPEPSMRQVDPAQERLAASLFGTGASPSGSAVGIHKAGPKPSPTPVQPEFDLLGGLEDPVYARHEPSRSGQEPNSAHADIMDLLGNPPSDQPSTAPPQSGGLDDLFTSTDYPPASAPMETQHLQQIKPTGPGSQQPSSSDNNNALDLL